MEDRSFEAAQRFLLAAKGFWTTTLHGRLREEYDSRCASAGANPQTVSEVAEIVEPLTLYRYFAWLERHLQSMKYSGRYGLARYYREKQDDILREFEADSTLNGQLKLDPDLELPEYYRATDIHQHPGGLWSEEVAGFVYEHGARSTTPLLGTMHADLHTRFTNEVAALGEFTRVLDMACGFGKSTLPFAQRFRKASIVGVDLSAPCLRVAASRARDDGLENVHFRQANAIESGFADQEFDLVTSTMYLHEAPPKVLERVFEECFRLLRPGGHMVHLDFWHLPDAFTRFLHYGHGRRNNEPYMQPLAEMDLPRVLKAKGFVDVEIRPFSESEPAKSQPRSAWRFPWTYIHARRP